MLSNNAKKFIKYWRVCLSDASLLQGAFTKKNLRNKFHVVKNKKQEKKITDEQLDKPLEDAQQREQAQEQLADSLRKSLTFKKNNSVKEAEKMLGSLSDGSIKVSDEFRKLFFFWYGFLQKICRCRSGAIFIYGKKYRHKF